MMSDSHEIIAALHRSHEKEKAALKKELDGKLIDAVHSRNEWKALAEKLEEERADACPCKHTTPCQPNCTCVNPFMSHGCRRCCRYGSKMQQEAKAKWLVEKEKLAEAIEAGVSPDYVRGLQDALRQAKSQRLDKETALANGEYRTGQYRGADDCCIMIQRLIDEAVKNDL